MDIKYFIARPQQTTYIIDDIDDKYQQYNIIKDLYNNTNIKIAICAIAKNENLYIKEWVEYYKTIGIDKIFLYDNNDINGEHFEDVISKYIENNFVEIINYRGKHETIDKKNAIKTLNHGTQQQAYEECYALHKNEYDWIGFLDIDEFFTCNMPIKEYFSLDKFKNVNAIQFNWIIYDDNDILFYDIRNVQDKFTRISKLQYNHVKTFINTKSNVLEIQCHRAIIENGNYVNSNGEKVECAFKQIRCLKDAYIKHYFTKSAEEWFLRKYKTTSATGKDYFNIDFSKRINEFFGFNKETQQKKDIFNFLQNQKENEQHPKLIVSFTSFGDRLKHDVDIMIESILNQTKKPDVIIMTIYKDDITNISEKIVNLIQQKKVILQIAKEDLKPHLKYFYTMINYRNDIIITVDDDHIYPNTLIEELYNSYLKYPSCISCRRMHKINKNLPYKQWKFEVKDDKPVYDTLPTGVGGILYPPNILKLTFNNIEEIKKCIKADDIYLKYLEYMYHIPVIYAPNKSSMGKNINSVYEKHNRLCDSNVTKNGNDYYLKLFKIID